MHKLIRFIMNAYAMQNFYKSWWTFHSALKTDPCTGKCKSALMFYEHEFFFAFEFSLVFFLTPLLPFFSYFEFHINEKKIRCV